jgi:hypothetical protein
MRAWPALSMCALSAPLWAATHVLVVAGLGGTPEYRDLRVWARVGSWRNEADCAFADWLVASGRLPSVRWVPVPTGRIQFVASLPRPAKRDTGLG